MNTRTVITWGILVPIFLATCVVAANERSGKSDTIVFSTPMLYPAGNEVGDGFGLEAKDLNGDGAPDLAMTKYNLHGNDSIVIMLNNGDGVFPNRVTYPTSASASPTHIAGADLDNNGSIDLAVTHYYSGVVSVFYNNGDGTYPVRQDYPIQFSVYEIACVDIDLDGDVDIITHTPVHDAVYVMINDGQGAFPVVNSYAVGRAPGGLYCADFNNDSFPDIATANSNVNNVSILINDRNGGFLPATSYPTGERPIGTYCADLNKDGAIDIVTGNLNGADFSILFGNGDGSFDTPVNYGLRQAGAYIDGGDFDSDGDIDLAATVPNGGSNDTLLIFENEGNGVFHEEGNYRVAFAPNVVKCADFNGDNRIDIAVTCPNSDSVAILFNETVTGKLIIPPVVTCNPANAPAEIAVKVFAQSDDSICGFSTPLAWTGPWDLDSVSRVSATTEAWETWAAVIDNVGDSVKFGGYRIMAQAVPPEDSQLIAILYFHPTITVGISDSLLLIIDTFTTAPQSSLTFTDCSPQAHDFVPEISFGTSIFYGYMAGDANGDRNVKIGDCVYIINYVFRGGPAPVPLNAGDANGDGTISVGDAVYLVNYIFRGGPAPVCGRVTGLAACCQNGGVPDVWFKLASVSITSVYDGDVTEIAIQSPTDIYGLQIEVKGDDGAAVVNQVELTQLYHQWNNGAATVGILDINGIGRIPAGETTVLTIAGEATVLSALGADAQGQTFEITVGEAAKTEAIPSQFALHQNRPNPFNPTTEIAFSLPSATDVTLEVYNVTGQRIATLVSGHLEAGNHTVVWNGKDENDRTASSGIYLYRIKAGEFAETKKMVLLK